MSEIHFNSIALAEKILEIMKPGREYGLEELRDIAKEKIIGFLIDPNFPEAMIYLLNKGKIFEVASKKRSYQRLDRGDRNDCSILGSGMVLTVARKLVGTVMKEEDFFKEFPPDKDWWKELGEDLKKAGKKLEKDRSK